MDLNEFDKINRQRSEAPDGFDHKLDSWSLSDWITAITGELGEAANVVKKLNRIRDGIPGNKVSEAELRAKLVQELADATIYLNLFFQRIGSNMAEAMILTFNAKSKELGMPYIIVDRCKKCSGTGFSPSFSCTTCGGSGISQSQEESNDQD